MRTGNLNRADNRYPLSTIRSPQSAKSGERMAESG
jgi:hypothetical protein